jgi:hypothetical protein
MELPKKLEIERRERAKLRKEAILQNKMTPEQLTGILAEDAVSISSRCDRSDTHEARRWSKEMTEDFLQLRRVIGDRDPTVQRINGLRLRIAACRLPFIWAVALNEADGTVYRINGNTTANIASAYPELFEGAWVYWSTFVCTDLEEVHLLYSQYDAQLSSRRITEALLPFVIAFGIEMQPTVVSAALSGVTMVRLGHLPSSNFEDKLMTLYDCIPFLYWLGDNIFLTKNNTTRFFTRAPVLSFLYAAWNSKHRDLAVKFARRLIYVNENTYEPNDPCLTLNRQLIATPAPRSAGDFDKYQLQYSWCVLAWNAFIREERLSVFHVVEGKKLPEMLGTDRKFRATSKLPSSIYIKRSK